MTPLLALANKLEKLASDLPEIANKLAIATAVEVSNTLYNVTPVDTSTALSNWQINLNNPVSDPIPAYVPGSLGYTASPSTRAAQQVVQEKLALKKPGQTIFISNVLDYIVNLNNGSSRQEPAGFVHRAAETGRFYIRRTGLKVLPND